MLRPALVIGVVLLSASSWAIPAEAGQASSSFSVGITIGGARAPARPQPSAQALKYTWNAAAISVRRAGFEAVERLEAGAGVYWFRAERQGRRYRVAVSVTSGEIVTVTAA